MKAQPDLSLAAVASARRRLAGAIRVTPCLPAPALSAAIGFSLRLKRDDLQRTGSSRERGARHALLCLSEADRARGIVAASAGSFAFGLAYHASMLGLRVTIVLPAATPAVKVTHCRSLGATVELHGANLAEARAHAAALAPRLGAVNLDPATDPHVRSGQATLALEVLEQFPVLDTLVVPIGAGLWADATAVLRDARPDVRVIGVQRAGDGNVTTVDSARFVTVTPDEIAAATNLLACRAGIVAGTVGAMPLAAALTGQVRPHSGGEVVLAVCAKCHDPRRHAQAVARGAEWLEHRTRPGRDLAS